LRDDALFKAEKISSLWANRSRIKRYENFSSIVIEVSVLGRRMHGAKLVANAETYSSSAEVKSISLVKWVINASSVAMFAKRRPLRVFCRTATRFESGVEYNVFITS
jgi:hypothetical protein